MKKLFFIALSLFSIVNGLAQERKRLNDNWEFLKSDLGGIWEAVRLVGKGNPESVPLWEKVTLPHCVNALDAVDPDVNYYQGPSWYRTRLEIKNPYQNGRTFLHFEGAGQKTEVYIYTKKVGEHVGGYDEWTLDITDAVAEFQKHEAYQKEFQEKIPLSIRTDNSRNLEMIPSDLSDFNLYGGLYRYVNLIYEAPISIRNLFVDADAASGNVTLRLYFNEPLKAQNISISASVKDPSGKTSYQQTINANASEEVTMHSFRINNVQRWSVEQPKLYTLRLTVKDANGISSTKNENFGFRDFEFIEKGPFHLNGKRLLLRGTHRHEDHAGVGAAMTESMMRKEMIMMKEMGVNFIRLGHYQQSRIILDLCDSLGILVWEEIPWCRGGLGGEKFQSQAKRMLDNMIAQHYNHPSIIIWGLGNENDWPGDFETFDKEKIRAFMKELNDLSHQLDSKRKTAIRRCDFCKDIVDVYSPSIWAGWYRGVYTDYKTVSETERDRVKHFLHVEWGGDSHARRHSENPDKILAEITGGRGADERAGDASLFGGSARVSKDGDWSESYICNLIDWHLKEQETMPWLSGSAYWPFKDFSTPVRPDNPVPYVNQKGVVERDFTKKESYYVFQSWWTTKPMAHIYGHSWPVRWGDANEQKMLKVYSNCDEAELFLNGKSLGTKKRNGQDFPASGLRWLTAFQVGRNSVKVVARKGKTMVEDTLSFEYQIKKWEQPAKLSLKILERNNDAVKIEVTVHDKNDVLCLDDAAFVRFGVTGNGTLIENLGTSTGSRYVQTYNGRAIISVNLIDGKSVASVTRKGLPTAFLTLP